MQLVFKDAPSRYEADVVLEATAPEFGPFSNQESQEGCIAVAVSKET
jgi:hypothetical protein